MTTFKCCSECSEHFGVQYPGMSVATTVEGTTDPTECNYHTDYTGRASQKNRLLAEWSANNPEGWASV